MRPSKIRSLFVLLSAALSPTLSHAYLGGFEAQDGYLGSGTIPTAGLPGDAKFYLNNQPPNFTGVIPLGALPADLGDGTHGVDVTRYNAGAFGSNNGGSGGSAADIPDNSGLWRALAGGRLNEDANAPYYEPAFWNDPLQKYRHRDYIITYRFGARSGSFGLDLLALDADLVYEYDLDSRDFDGQSPTVVRNGCVQMITYICPNSNDDAAVGTNVFGLGCLDFNGDRFLEWGYTGDDFIQFRTSPNGAWTTSTVQVGNNGWSKVDLAVNLSLNTFTLKITPYLDSANTLGPEQTVANAARFSISPLGWKTLRWALLGGPNMPPGAFAEKHYFDDFNFILTNNSAHALPPCVGVQPPPALFECGNAPVADWPFQAVTAQATGNPLGAGSSARQPAVLLTRTGASGQPGSPNYFNPLILASTAQVGSVWGVAWDESQKRLLISSVLRRHAGFGPEGIGGIYQYNALTGVVEPLLDVNDLPGVSVGADPRSVSNGLPLGPNELPFDATTPSWDVAAFSLVGKTGLGGIDVAPNGKLWAVNLHQRTLLEIDLSASPVTAQAWPIPDAGFTNGTSRPWAVKAHNNRIFVGTVGDASNGSAADLKAAVLEFNPATDTWCLTYSFPLNYPREDLAPGIPGAWRPWTDAIPPVQTNQGAPQPILTDIEFDAEGSIIVALSDRFSLQMGYDQYAPDIARTDKIRAVGGGDVLRIGNVSGSYVLENNGTSGAHGAGLGAPNSGPGGKEFYYGDNGVPNLAESTSGGLAYLPGSNSVSVTSTHPLAPFTYGITSLSNATGAATARLELLAKTPPPEDLHRHGLGDLEIFCCPVPHGVGNLVYRDTNGNGHANPGEGRPHVTVQLCHIGSDGLPNTWDDTLVSTDASGSLLGTPASVDAVETDSDGGYAFRHLPAGQYVLKIKRDEFGVAGDLSDWMSAPGSRTDSSDDDTGENGTDSFTPAVDGVSSNVVTLRNGTAPLDASETGWNGASDAADSQIDLTVDFGFVPKCESTMLLVGELLNPSGTRTLSFPYSPTTPTPCPNPLPFGGDGIAQDAALGVVYIADAGGTIYRYQQSTQSHSVFLVIGSGAYDVALSPDGSRLYIASSDGLRAVNTTTAMIEHFLPLSSFPSGSGRTWGVAVHPQTAEIYVTRGFQPSVPHTGTLFKVRPDFVGVPSLVSTADAGTRFMGIKFRADGTAWLTNEHLSGGTDRILHIDSAGIVLQSVALGGSWNAPNDIDFGPDGHIYVSTWANQCVLRYNESAATWDVYLPLDPAGNGKSLAWICGAVNCPKSVGNLVFLDKDHDGKFEPNGNDNNPATLADNETGIDGVTLEIFRDNGNHTFEPGIDLPAALPQMTSNGGCYRFDGLAPGAYFIQVSSSNFSGVLTGHLNSFGQNLLGLDDDAGEDGTDGLEPMVNGVVSGLVDLNGSAPTVAETGKDGTSDDAHDSNIDLTVDFGFVPASRLLCGQVRHDHDGDGDLSDPDVGHGGSVLVLTYDRNQNGIVDLGDPVLPPLQVPVSGHYCFGPLPDGHYIVEELDPAPVTSTADRAGANDNSISVVLVGGDSFGNDFLNDFDPQGYIYLPANGCLVTGGIVTVSGPPGATVTILQDGSNGFYAFWGDVPGTYSIFLTPPAGYVADPQRPANPVPYDATPTPNPNVIGSGLNGDGKLANYSAPANPWHEAFVLSLGDALVVNNNIPVIELKPDDWQNWVYNNGLNGTLPSANADGDLYRNLEEFAFCLPPHNGLLPGCPLEIFTQPDGTVRLCVRQLPNPVGLTYTLEGISDLANSSAGGGGWTQLITTISTLPNPDGSITACYENLEQQLNGTGFVRIRLDADTDGNGSLETTVRTLALGWMTHGIATQCETFSMPFLKCETFAGAISSNTPSALTIAPTSLAGNFAASLDPAKCYAVEVLSGPHEGHWWRVSPATSGANTIGVTTGTKTLTANLLAGATVVVRELWQFQQLFPVANFSAGLTPADPLADNILTFTNAGGWTTHFLAETTPRHWLNATNSSISDADCLWPGQGIFFHRKGAPVNLLLSGAVRQTKLAVPLQAGNNLVGSAYPVDLSPAQRGMTWNGSNFQGFSGSTVPNFATQLNFWAGDANPGHRCYQTHWLLDAGFDPYRRWVSHEDSTANSMDDVQLFKALRAAFYVEPTHHTTYVMPVGWTP